MESKINKCAWFVNNSSLKTISPTADSLVNSKLIVTIVVKTKWLSIYTIQISKQNH